MLNAGRKHLDQNLILDTYGFINLSNSRMIFKCYLSEITEIEGKNKPIQ